MGGGLQAQLLLLLLVMLLFVCFCLFVPQSCDCFVPEEYVIDVVYGK